jgi:hypothetical protein
MTLWIPTLVGVLLASHNAKKPAEGSRILCHPPRLLMLGNLQGVASLVIRTSLAEALQFRRRIDDVIGLVWRDPPLESPRDAKASTHFSQRIQIGDQPVLELQPFDDDVDAGPIKAGQSLLNRFRELTGTPAGILTVNQHHKSLCTVCPQSRKLLDSGSRNLSRPRVRLHWGMSCGQVSPGSLDPQQQASQGKQFRLAVNDDAHLHRSPPGIACGNNPESR